MLFRSQENRYDAEGLRFELLENGRRTSFVYHNGELLHEEGREEQEISYHLSLIHISLHIDRDGRQLQRACNVFGQPVYEKASDAEGKHTNISTCLLYTSNRTAKTGTQAALGGITAGNNALDLSYNYDVRGPVSYTHLDVYKRQNPHSSYD